MLVPTITYKIAEAMMNTEFSVVGMRQVKELTKKFSYSYSSLHAEGRGQRIFSLLDARFML
jgi:hypothetical protein